MTMADWGTVLSITPLVGGVRLGLEVVPFRRLVRTLRRAARLFRSGRGADEEYERRVTWAVSAVGRRLLGDRPCLTEALVVEFLFHRRGLPATLQIGVDKGEGGELVAHAWVESNGRIVIGGAISKEKYHRLQNLEEKL